jgi:hypothetical protein
MYLTPETANNEIIEVFKIMKKCFPFCDDLEKKSKKVFTPHITCGSFRTENIEGIMDTFQKSWEPIVFTCSELYMISRDKETPFVISKTVKLCEPEE